MTDRAQALLSPTDESQSPTRRRGPGSPFLRCALAAFCALPLSIAAQEASPCKGPAELEHVLASNPSPGAFDALGAYFASHHQFSCAISAFESAIHLAPDMWDGHYNLGVALLSNGNPERA